MLDIILIALIIISCFKPDIMVNKKVREKATTEEIKLLAKNYRKIYLSIVLMLEGAVFMFETAGYAGVPVIGLAIFVVGIVIAIKNHVFSKLNKESKALVNDILNRNDSVVSVESATEEVKSEEA